MKPYLLSILLILAACGCSTKMTNEEIISECKKCKEAGMKSEIAWNLFTGHPVDVICLPQDSK